MASAPRFSFRRHWQSTLSLTRTSCCTLHGMCFLWPDARSSIDSLLNRPESICQKNGTAVTFISNNLRAILGDTFLNDIHKQVAQGAHDNTAQTVRDTNMQVERLRQEKKAEELRLQEAETAQKAAEAEAAKLHAQVAALEAARTVV